MKLEDLFNIEYPPTLIFSQQTIDSNGINFVSSSGKNNGIVERVKYNPQNKIYEAGSITVPLKGSVLVAFVQPERFYVAHQIAVLVPKTEMPLKNKIFYCLCIRKNAYKYNYGRQADRTLNEIELPDIIPEWVDTIKIPEPPSTRQLINKTFDLNTSQWKPFRYDKLFDIKKGKRITNHQMVLGETPCIRPIDSNNGVYEYIDIKPNHSENTITVNYNGSVAEAFYQPKPYFALDDVNVLYPKPNFKLNIFIAMFLVTLIKKEKYRFNYGRKWKLERMNESIIKLPVDENGKPNFEFMENYIKSLPYSSSL